CVVHVSTDAEPAVIGLLDVPERQPADVDQAIRVLDFELHQIKQVRAAADELRAGHCSGRNRGCDVGRAFVHKFSHTLPPAANSRMASMMFGYAQQRQTLPLIRSRSSASVNSMLGDATSAVTWLGIPAFASSSMAIAEQIWPGVQ